MHDVGTAHLLNVVVLVEAKIGRDQIPALDCGAGMGPADLRNANLQRQNQRLARGQKLGHLAVEFHVPRLGGVQRKHFVRLYVGRELCKHPALGVAQKAKLGTRGHVF